MTKIILGLGVLIFGFASTIAYADPITVHALKDGAVEVVKVDNKICPVDGEKIGSMEGEEPATVEYKGKTYSLCCSHCIEAFQKEADKFSKMADAEVEKNTSADSSDDHNHDQGDQGHKEHKDHDHKD